MGTQPSFFWSVARWEFNDGFLRSLADRFSPSLFYDRWPIVFADPIFAFVGVSESNDSFLTIVSRPFSLFCRYLADRNPTIPFYDRWSIFFNGPLFTIVGLSQPNDPFYTIIDG